MEKDSIFEMAERYVKLTGRSIFLTGKAGTGKTTFLKYITRTTSKRFVVLAPTGVAAPRYIHFSCSLYVRIFLMSRNL